MGGSWSSAPSTSSESESATATPSQATGAESILETQPKKKPVDNNNKRDVVVIPVDASKQCLAAFNWYVEYVHRPEHVVHIVHCRDVQQPVPVLAGHAVKTKSWYEMVRRADEDGKNLLNLYEEKLRENNVKGTVNFASGNPGVVIVDATRKHNASMVVMGSRGLGLIRRTILGSVSEYVIHHTDIPVTIVPKQTASWFF